MIKRLETIGLRIKRSGVRIAPGPPLKTRLLAYLPIKSFSEICRYILQNNHVFPKFCQTGAIVERTLPC